MNAPFAGWRRRPARVAMAAMLAIAVGLGCGRADADAPWAQWRGPNRDGFVAGAAWPDGLDQSRVEKRWRTELGPSY